VEKKAVLITSFILALCFSLVAATQFVNFGRANPYFQGGTTAPPPGAEPPTIAIFSPTKDNAIFASNNISLTFNVSISEATYMLTDVYYETDWQEGNTSAYHLDMSTPDYIYSRSWITEFSYNKTLTGIAEGKHNITVIASAHGYFVREMTAYHFDIGGSSVIHFTIDTPPTLVTVLSIENKTYENPDIPLNFTVTEATSQITYILDGQENMTNVGNTTLTDLSEGKHNMTICAIDFAGNKGTSETIYFSVEVPDPFPTITIVASAVSVTVSTGFLLYYTKRRRKEAL